MEPLGQEPLRALLPGRSWQRDLAVVLPLPACLRGDLQPLQREQKGGAGYSFPEAGRGRWLPSLGPPFQEECAASAQGVGTQQIAPVAARLRVSALPLLLLLLQVGRRLPLRRRPCEAPR